jgi:hypothetical protein
MSNETKQTTVDDLFQKLWDEPKDKFTWNAILAEAKEGEIRDLHLFAQWILKHYTIEHLHGTIGYINPTGKEVFTETIVEHYLNEIGDNK